MLTSRRSLLSLVATGALLGPTLARAEDLTRTERAIGKADAKTTVIECFSLTCSHCATFALNGLDFTAFQIARTVPPESYVPFVEALLSSQDRWAFARGVNNVEEIWKTAALAGMSRATFDKAVGDEGLKTWIATQQQVAVDKWKVSATPTFIVNNEVHSGEMGFDDFRKLIPDA
jgi:protein-disulfide isomerase